jgi:hypothetical protein
MFPPLLVLCGLLQKKKQPQKQTHGEIVLLLLCDSVLTLENDHEIAIWGKETLVISL